MSTKLKGTLWSQHKESLNLAIIRVFRKDFFRFPGSISPEDWVEKVYREISLLKLVVHPNIARMLDYFENKDFIYICMENLKGETLEDFCHHLRGKQFGQLGEDDVREIVF